MIVLDCSAAVHIARKTNEGKALRSLFLENERVISSQLYLIELVSAFSKYPKAGLTDKPQAAAYLEQATKLVEELVPIEENYLEAFTEGIRLNHSPYDMLYFTLARRKAATLVTLDLKLIKLCEQEGVDCIAYDAI